MPQRTDTLKKQKTKKPTHCCHQKGQNPISKQKDFLLIADAGDNNYLLRKQNSVERDSDALFLQLSSLDIQKLNHFVVRIS